MSTHKQPPQKGGPCHPAASRAVRPALVNACELLLACEKDRELRGGILTNVAPSPSAYLAAVEAAKEAFVALEKLGELTADEEPIDYFEVAKEIVMATQIKNLEEAIWEELMKRAKKSSGWRLDDILTTILDEHYSELKTTMRGRLSTWHEQQRDEARRSS